MRASASLPWSGELVKNATQNSNVCRVINLYQKCNLKNATYCGNLNKFDPKIERILIHFVIFETKVLINRDDGGRSNLFVLLKVYMNIII